MSHQAQAPKISDEEFDDLLNSRGNTGPVPILRSRAETRVIRELKEIALKGCDDLVGELARCAQGKVFSVVWKCRSQKQAVDACMRRFAEDQGLQNEMRRRYVKRILLHMQRTHQLMRFS